MRKPNRKNDLIATRLAETQMNPYDRERALDVLETAQQFAEGVVWFKEKLAAFGTHFLKPGLKH